MAHKILFNLFTSQSHEAVILVSQTVRGICLKHLHVLIKTRAVKVNKIIKQF